MHTILLRTLVAIGGTARSGDSIIDLRRKILAISGYNLGAQYSELFALCSTIGGSPRSGDSVIDLTRKIATVLIAGGAPEPGTGLTTFGGDAIETFGGSPISLFT